MAAVVPGGTSPSNLRFPSPNSFSRRSFAPPPTVRFLGPSLPPCRLRISPPSRRSISARSGRVGGFGDRGNGGSGGGGGDEGESGESGNNNRAEALLALAKVGRTLESLPKDFAAAIENGRIPGLIVQRFFKLERSPVFRWLLQFGGFNERLLADDLFLAKLAMECGVGIFTKTAAEWERRRENFVRELDFVIPDVRNGAKLFVVETTASLIGTGVTNALIKARQTINNDVAFETEDVPIVSTSVAYGVDMAISSTLRYQVLAGGIEQRILEPFLHNNKLALSALRFAVRTWNTFLGKFMRTFLGTVSTSGNDACLQWQCCFRIAISGQAEIKHQWFKN